MEDQEQVKNTIKVIPQYKLKPVSNAIEVNSKKNITSDRVEEDKEFVEDVLAIAEHTIAAKKEVFAKRAQLTEEQYELIQTIGQVHYKANKYNETSDKELSQIAKLNQCQCGCKRGFGEPLPFCIDQEEEHFFGLGIILFFFYTKRMILVVLTICILYAIYSLVTNMVVGNYSSNCKSPGPLPFLCQYKIESSVEAKEGREDLMIGQLILGLVVCIFWSISLRLIRAVGRRKMRIIDERLNSSSDYCILLQNLPEGQYSEADIINFLSEKWRNLKEHNKSRLKIRAVQVIYKMGEVREKISQIQDLSLKIESYFEKQGEGQVKSPYKIKEQCLEAYKEDKKKIAQIYNELKKYRKRFLAEGDFRKDKTSSCVFVQFSLQQQQSRILDQFGVFRMTLVKELIKKIKDSCSETEELTFKGRSIRMTRAPEPSDIFWQHCEKKVQTKMVLLVWFINIVLLGCSLGVLILINYIKSEFPGVPGLGVVGIVALNLFNRLIWNVLQKVVLKEQNFTKTDNIISVMNKSYFAQAVNIIIVPMVVQVGINGKLDGASGLMGQIHDYQLLSLLFMILFNFINVPHRIVQIIQCIKCFRRAAIQYYSRVSGDLDTIAQMKDAITFLYEPPIIPVAGFYVYITTIMSQAAFYCHLSPVILFYLLLNMLLFHLINRYLLLRMSKIPDLIDYLVFETCVGFAQNFSLLYGVGSIVFLNLRGDAPNFGYYVPSILCIVVWFFAVQSPFGVCRCIVGTFMSCFYPQVEEEEKELKKDKKFDITIDKLQGNENMKEEEEQSEKQMSTRIQNYYGGNGTLALFNLENKLRQAAGPYHEKNKNFCEKFKLNVKYKRSRDAMF